MNRASEGWADEVRTVKPGSLDVIELRSVIASLKR